MRVIFCVYGYSPDVERLQPWLTVHQVASVMIASGWEVHLLTDVDRQPTLEGLKHHYVRTMRPSNMTEVRAVVDAIVPDRIVVLTTPLNLMLSGWYNFVRCKLIAFLTYPFYTHAELTRALPHLRRDDFVAYGRHALVPKLLWARTQDKRLTLDAAWNMIPPAFYPHMLHSKLLDCNNCHPEIFNIKKKSTERFSMQRNLDGQFCGVCHMTVAFPMNDCKRCHPSKRS